MASEIIGTPAADIARRVRAGEVSAREVAIAHLDAIEEVDPIVGAFQSVRREAAVREAEELDRGDVSDLPLAGVPVAIKDNLDVAGEPTRCGSRASDPSPRSEDHETVRLLRQAGSIVIGKTRVPELCIWGRTDSAFGTTRNPWDPSRACGGSSGGSAAAVAAALVPLAMGTDGMGSIRIPAAACGVVGMKPGPGLVPGEDIGVSGWSGMNQNGALAARATDAALMLSIIGDRPELARVEPPPPQRVAISVRPPVVGTRVSRASKGAALSTGELLDSLGHHVASKDPPYTIRNVLPMGARWTYGTAEDAALLDPALVEARTRTHARVGRLLRAIGQMRETARDRWCAAMDRFFEDVDVLVTPALAQLPPRAEGWHERSWPTSIWADMNYAPFAAPWNFARLPAIAIPTGSLHEGLPLAVQLVTARGREDLLLNLAAQIEAARPWPPHAPVQPR